MDEKQETIADILAEMHRLVKPGETLEHTYELLNGLADRIESAQKMEVGNGAKMREALEQIAKLMDEILVRTELDDEIHRIALEAQNMADGELLLSPRNCDRFNTLEDALSGWREVSPDESGPFDNWLFAEAKGVAK